ncbi:hypothetical protein ER57_09900 [Smithella sp. SCADC]|jgi:hypothetical protein|nr:hypothetical protein ER57_09900 [Smithella sp. SCADC]
MKRFWLVLLSLGLVMAFSVQAFAVDLKVSGSYYAAGMYLDKSNLQKDAGTSTAFYFQRLRVQTDFVVSPGLTLVTRFDVMERAWGAARSTNDGTPDTSSSATRSENENIGFDHVYIQYASPIGTFIVGSMPNDTIWGTPFGDNIYDGGAARVVYIVPVDKFTVLGGFIKIAENSYTANNNLATRADADADKYFVATIFNDKNIEAGLFYTYMRYANTRSSIETSSFQSKIHVVEPYVKVALGPVKIQAEIDYWFGKWVEMDSVGADTDLSSIAGWIDAVATFGPVYVGGSFAYSQGQGTDTTDLNELADGGTEWSPTLIMWNQDRSYWVGNLNGNDTTKFGNAMINAFFYQIRGGVKPTDKLDICASVSMARADKTPASYVSKDYGYEIDVTGTYKLTNNLSYMLGFGYLFTGDYFKGTNSANSIDNDYLLINKLTLTF